MPKRGRNRRKTRTHVIETETAGNTLKSREELSVPKSLVIRRGKVEEEVNDLQKDLRRMMMPYTALNFREDARNRKANLALYAKEMGASMGITHLLALSQNGPHLNLRLGRTPSGPTLAFKVKSFSLSRQVRSIQRRPYDSKTAYRHAPVVVTNNFGDASAPPHVKLMRITFQNMSPAVNVATVKLGECRRVVLFNFIRRDVEDGDGDENGKEGDHNKEEDEEVEIRHYAIRATPVGVNRKVRRIINAKIPNLSKLDDVADYITGKTSTGAPAISGYASAGASDSEPEDDTSHVVLSQKYAGRGNAASQKSALKLVELGPRMRLKLFKVQRGLDEGDVMYHAYVSKSPTEVKEQRARIKKASDEKRARREVQDANVRRKEAVREEKRESKRARKEVRDKEAMEELRRGGRQVVASGGGGNDGGEDESSSSEEEEDNSTASGSEDDSDDDE